MRVNLPVTNKEQTFGADERLISTTNLKGVIESANATFVRVSGFSIDELAGKPHNLVRHPDMPEAVYQNFWDTLKAGKPWMGVVKNRCKNGDHYWVSAYVSPVFLNGEQTGYQSVRTCATEAQKQRAEALYARVRKGGAVRPLWHRGDIRQRIGAFALVGLVTGVLGGFLAGQGEAAIGGLIALLGVLIACGGTAYATRNLARLSSHARSVFDNDVGCVTYGDGHDVVAEAELALAMQSAQLTALRGRVEDLTTELAGAARNSSQAAEDGRRAISDQEQEILQVVTAMEEMAATVQEVSRNTSEASTTTLEVSQQAETGRDTIVRTANAMRSLATDVGEATAAMEALREETRSIRKVLEVINAIAAQTNLLALNAAIEAARAGESGRGFAVVATEVRELAARVSESTGDIGRMIEQLETRAEGAAGTMRQSQESANVVATDAEESSRVIIDIERSVEQIRDMTVQIATAAEEQSATADEINRRVSSVNDGVAQTADIAGRTKQTSDQLVAMVEELQGVMLQFKGH
ncbi:aerotaxis receptor [Natronocella acetinitrilica]|uniref:Aerotaxis receptor n=2 Tax=Natronocella acetinitrilica TaxID=414046 RepID=A0AAE3KHL0_9GAMM|nr:aerotaxis receptor [Natronocella acetinitrilica]